MNDKNDTTGLDGHGTQNRGVMTQTQTNGNYHAAHVVSASSASPKNGNDDHEPGLIHIPWKPLSAEESSALRAHAEAMYPNDENFVEINPSPEDWLFWRSHERLWHCYVHAQAIGRSPSAMLLSRVRRLASVIAPEYTTGDLGAGGVSLDVVVAPYGESGSGKTTLTKAAKDSLPLDVEVLSIGGFSKAGLRDAVAVTDKATGNTIRTGYTISAFIDEGEVIEAAAKQGGSDLLPTLRALAHGQSSVLSTANSAGGAGLVMIEDMTLRFTGTINMQQAHVPILFNSKRINDGTLQRLMFVDAEERFVRRRENRPAVPSPLLDVMPKDLLLPGMNSVGVVEPAAAAAVLATTNTSNSATGQAYTLSTILDRPKPRRSAVPDALIRYVEKANLARATEKKTKTERNAQARQSHRIVDVGRLSTLMAIYMDSTFHPETQHVEAALHVVRFLDRTVVKIEKDIQRMAREEQHETGTNRGHERLAEKRVIQKASDFDATVSKIVEMLRAGRFESKDPDFEIKTNELRRKCRVRGANTHFDRALDYLMSQGKVSKRPGVRTDSSFVRLAEQEDDESDGAEE